MNQFGGTPFVGGGFPGAPQPFVQQPFPGQYGNPAAFGNPMPAYQGANFFPNNGVAFPPAGFPAPQPAMGAPGQFGPAFPYPPGGFGFPPAAPPQFAPPFPSNQFGAFPPPPPPLIPDNYFGSGAYGRPRSRHRSSSRRRRHHQSSSSSESDEPRRGSPFGGNPYNNAVPFGMNPPPIPPRLGSPFLPPVRPGW